MGHVLAGGGLDCSALEKRTQYASSSCCVISKELSDNYGCVKVRNSFRAIAFELC